MQTWFNPVPGPAHLREAVGAVLQPLHPVARQEQVAEAGGLRGEQGREGGTIQGSWAVLWLGVTDNTRRRGLHAAPHPPLLLCRCTLAAAAIPSFSLLVLSPSRTCVGRHCALPGEKWVTARGKRSTAESTT